MSSESDSGEFFDAEDNTPVKNTRTKNKSPVRQVTKNEGDDGKVKANHRQESSELPDATIVNAEASLIERREIERKALENEKRRRRLEEMRKRVNDDDDNYDLTSEMSSQTSSIDSMYVQQFVLLKTVETDDAQSTMSLGKVGQILSGSDVTSLTDYSNEDHQSPGKLKDSAMGALQEPDVVASTKGDRPYELQPPVAPPRRKRKSKNLLAASGQKYGAEATEVPLGPSPSSSMASLSKDYEHSLDLSSALKGQYVVKPQDNENDKAEGPPSLADVFLQETASASTDAGVDDEDPNVKQQNMIVRTRTDSGKQLTDLEILEQVMVLNLDTGEQIPLSLAEDRLPRCINPLSLHIMRLTSEYVSNSSLDKDKESDEDADDLKKSNRASDRSEAAVKRRTKKIRKLINRTVNRIKSVAEELNHARHNEEAIESSEDEPTGDKHAIKFKNASGHKGPYEFDNLRLIQDLMGEHSGAVWTMKFSYCGRLLATAGQDHILRVWVLRDAFDYFNNKRQKYNTECKVSPSPSQESLSSHQSAEDADKAASGDADADGGNTVFNTKPFCTYSGHTADLLDVSWSKNYFILSSSMDKTVRLWHISRKECLCCFQHIDFVTAIAFHPRDDRYFISGSLDGKLRLWNIPDKKVALWNELDGQTKLITAANFCQNGKFAVVGSYDGRCIFYNTEDLKYYTQIHVRSTRGKNAKGRKISGIEPMPGEDKILVTSNDSRIRLYDLRDLSLSCKYKGYVNLSSQIRASFSHDGKFIISGSENQYFYAWKTHYDYSKFSSARRDRNDYWEGIKAHNAMVTAAVFAPKPSLIFRQLDNEKSNSEEPTGYIIVTADFNGGIKIFANKSKSKATSS